MSALATRFIVYNANNLEDIAGLTITGVNSYNAPNRDLKIYSIVNSDMSVVSGDYYPSRTIEISGHINRPSKDLLETSLDTLRSQLDVREKVLSVKQSNTTREYTATMQNLIVRNLTGGFCEFGITFFCSDPMGYNTVYTTLLDVSNLTITDQSYAFTTEGTGEQLPVITITIDAITGGTASMIWKNLTRNETTTMDRTWAVGEILVMDAENGTIQVDGTDIDFSGPIPRLDGGDNTVLYDDEFTTRTVDIVIDYRKRYI